MLWVCGHSLTLTALELSEYDACGRQFQTTKVYPPTVRVKLFLMAVDT